MTRIRSTARWIVLALALTLTLMNPALAQDCELGWDFDFGDSGATGIFWDFAVYDDGTGPALFAGGEFVSINGTRIGGLAKWDGRSWSDVGGGLHSDNYPGRVFALKVWDDGRGPALYVGGAFSHAGQTPVNSIARWDGRTWEALGSGIDGVARSLATFDDGRGEALYVGGKFRHAGRLEANLIARWDGRNWEPLGQGLYAYGNFLYGVLAMTTFDDGHGPWLYVGGDFDDIRDEYRDRYVQADRARIIARWNGNAWSVVPRSNLQPIANYHVDDLMVYDNGDGPKLYVVGAFKREINGRFWQGLISWDGHDWSVPLPDQPLHFSGLAHPFAMTTFDDGSGPALWFGGSEVGVPHHGRWYTSSVFALERDRYHAPAVYPAPFVNALASFDDGSGSALYVGGDFDRFRFPDFHWIPVHGITRYYPPRITLTHTPLIAGQTTLLTTTCASPGQRVYFAYSTTGLNSLYIPQLDVTIELNHPHVLGSSVASIDGEAKLQKHIPQSAAGRTIYLQSAQHRRASRVIEEVIR